MPDFVNHLHDKKMRYVPIIDAGIAKREDYDVYADGAKEGIYIMDGRNQSPSVGRVWPGDAVWPDWFNPNAAPWWQKWVQSFWDQVPFDGLWLDMNEASNFCNGPCYPD